MPSVSSIAISAIINKLSGLKDVELLIKSKFSSEVAVLQDIPSYLLALGGKRIRPVLALLCAQALGLERPSAALVDVSAGIELIHMATLLHDDIIDKSPKRRHQESPYLKYGIEASLLSGDFLLVRAFSLCSKLDRNIIEATETACIELVEGEALEIPLHKGAHNLESSLLIAKKKTAALFQLAAYCGASLSDKKAEKYFAEFGLNLGVAFQILDDILDVVADENLLGKKSGLDLIERKPSVINVLWLNSGDDLARTLLKAPADYETEEAFRQSAIKQLRNSCLIDQAKAIATEYINKASAALKLGLANSTSINHKAVKALEAIVDYTTERMG